MSNSASQPWPIPEPNIPGGYCYEPANLKTIVKDDLVTFMWDSPHDNDGFYLSYKRGTDVATQVTVFGTATQIKLSPGATYTWSVRTMCDRIANRGSDVTVGPPFNTGIQTYACPVINNAAAIIIKSANVTRIEWTAVPGVKEYELEVALTASKMPALQFKAPINYINLSTLNPGAEYRWRIKPVCNGSEFSPWIYFTTGPGLGCPAVKVSATISVTTGVIYWTHNEAASGYQIYLNGTLIDANHPVNIYTLSNLQPLTKYNVLVIPNCENGAGDMGSLDMETIDYPVPNPTNLAGALNSQKNLSISWTPAAPITSQEIMVNGSKTTLLASANQHIVDLPAPNSKYNILIRSIIDGVKSTGAFLSVAIPDFCQQVSSVQTLSKNHNSVTLGWPLAAGADSYKIRYSLKGSPDWVTVPAQGGDITIRGLIPNKTYIFEVYSQCGTSISAAAEHEELTLQQPQCPMAINLRATNLQPTSFNIEFGLTQNAEEGAFDVSVKQGVGAPVFFQGKTSPIAISGLTQNLPYVVIITNNCSSNPSVSEPVTITTPKVCTAPVFATCLLTTSNTVLSASWGAVAGVTGYGIRFRQLGAEDWTTLPDQVGVSFTNAAVSSLYEVEVTSIYADGRRCATIQVTDIPKVLLLVNKDATVRGPITWAPIQGVDDYKVTINSTSEDYELYPIQAGLQPYLSPLVTYAVVVRGRYNNVLGTASDTLTYTTDATIIDDDGCNGPELAAWKQDSNINDSTATVSQKVDIQVEILDYDPQFRYKIDIVVEDNVVPIATRIIEVQQDNADGIVQFIKLLANNYRAVVTRYGADEKICIRNTVVKLVTCATPAGLAGSAITDTSVKMNWGDVAGALAYELYQDSELIGLYSESEQIVTGLTPNTDYVFKVRTKCGITVYSPFSGNVTIHTDVAP